MTQDFRQIIDEYSEEYCDFLEAAYGKGMLSEGGEQAVKKLFDGVSVYEKKVLDIGFGAGGAAVYLAKQQGAIVSGIEINPQLVERARRLIPEEYAAKLHFEQYTKYPELPFSDEQFDVVYSKGVLTHVEDKLPLFREIYRATKADGVLVINDWLSPVKNQWAPEIHDLCETEGLTLYAETIESYLKVLRSAGFEPAQSLRDETSDYANYNGVIAQNIKNNTDFLNAYGLETVKEAARCYQLISDAMMKKDLLVMRFVARKLSTNEL